MSNLQKKRKKTRNRSLIQVEGTSNNFLVFFTYSNKIFIHEQIYYDPKLVWGDGWLATFVAERERERELCIFFKDFQTQNSIFLFLEVFSFLFFIRMQQGWVDGIFCHHKYIASLNMTSNIVILDYFHSLAYFLPWRVHHMVMFVCSIMFEQPIELFSKMLLHCATMNSNTHSLGIMCSILHALVRIFNSFHLQSTSTLSHDSNYVKT
jgi:hypothetical protein